MFSLPHRKVEPRCPQVLEMSRKRRKSCKGRKSSDSREYEQLPPTCKCKQNLESLENKVDEELTHFSEPSDVKGSEENGKDHENKNQNTSDASEDRDLDNVSGSEKEGKKGKNCPPQPFSPQQNEILATVAFGESEGSSTGKITLCSKPDSVKSISLATGKITAEVKYDSFNMKVEIKNLSLFGTGTNLVVQKRKSSKNSKRCHERRYQKSQYSKCPKYQCPSTSHSVDDNEKYKVSSKHKIQTATNKDASLKMNIEGKEIKVKYTNRKKNLMVNIKPGEQVHSKTCSGDFEDMYWSETDYSVTEAPCNTDCESYFSLHEKDNSTVLDGCILLPPPEEFADYDKMHLDTVSEQVSLYSDNDRRDSDSLSAALRIWEEENYFCKHNKKEYKDYTSEKEYFSKDKTISSKMNNRNILDSNILNKPNFDKALINKSSGTGQERNISDNGSDTEQKTARRRSFPGTTLDVLSPVHPRRDSGFYSLPSLSLKVLSKEAKPVDVYSKNSHPHTSDTELCKCPDFTSSLRSLKSSYQYVFTSFDHNITIYPSESLEDTCLLNEYANYMGQSEETEETLIKTLHSSDTINEKQENKHVEPLRNLAIREEDTESTESILDEGTPEYSHLEKHANLQNKTQLIRVSSPSRSPSGELISDKESTDDVATECVSNQLSALQPNVQLSPAEPAVTQKRRRSVMTVISGALEQRLIIQGDKLIPNSFGPAVRKEPKLPCSIKKKSLLSPLLWDPEELDTENELESLSEIQDISGNILDEANCHDDLAQAATLSTSSAYTEKKQIFTEHLYIKETTENLCSKQLSDNSLRREPGAHQLHQFAKSNSDETEKKAEMKEDFHQNTDIPTSSIKQICQKDLKSEMNKTRKLPLSKDTRASDSSQEEAIDQWARRRKQFKDSKKCSSTGGSSINSTITEGSIRERTVKISKGTGNYPWGFRIQFSKPILVTEVDTNSAAEEAGLQVGDILIAVNGTDVTSMPHSEAANLARKGPDILTMVVGSDISRYPNTPRPTCRGYLHKRTQSAILKGWRKRWFVLKHNGHLHYYKHKKDEGKCRPLEVTKLEGAEIGVDTSLGKPFVFKCVPQSGNRIFYFCATSNQEMKRWLEAMDKAVHPVHQNHVWVDVTLHNTTLPPLAIKNPECLGLLHQLDRNQDVWVQHYCILKDGCLYFYATLRSTPAQGGLYLQGYIVSEQSLGSKRSVIELKPPSEEFKTFYLCAENVNENKRWITALKASINKWLPLHQAIQDFMNRPLEETRM
ncbi:uncharacterized protein LOC112970155 isoform X2 [Apteryx rowi]|uniref:uncharacterized protein LOC112970155 isoform X2 n=1 Tax=Apteryx rowi TaxID=308060 RepID=UPI000E1E18ED|nr:uncharacterized protein LOC112970155 isoform X2 [Apteryx rowi]